MFRTVVRTHLHQGLNQIVLIQEQKESLLTVSFYIFLSFVSPPEKEKVDKKKNIPSFWKDFLGGRFYRRLRYPVRTQGANTKSMFLTTLYILYSKRRKQFTSSWDGCSFPLPSSKTRPLVATETVFLDRVSYYFQFTYI